METTTGFAPLARSFDDFEPHCSWQRDEAHDTLIIHLTEFKKNQLKVQINNQNILTMSGERPVTDTKWSRFSKQIKLSENCNTNEINTKFVGGLLYVTMPKKDVSSHEFWKETLGRRSRIDKKMVVSLVVAAVVALGAYLSIKYQSKYVAN